MLVWVDCFITIPLIVYIIVYIYNHGIVINYYWRLLMDRLVLSILLSTMILYEYYYYCLLLKIYTYIYISYIYMYWLWLWWLTSIVENYIYTHFFKLIVWLLSYWLCYDWLLMMIPLLTPCFPRRGPWVQPPRRCLSWKSIGKRKNGRTRHGTGETVFMLMAEIWVMRRGFHKGAFSKMHGL